MRIDIFVRDRRPYTYENVAAENVLQVFKSLRIEAQKIVIGDGVIQDYLYLLEEKPPAWILSFSECFQLRKPFCDLVKVPLFFWKHGSFAQAMHYFDSKHGIVRCSDRKVSDHFSHPFFPDAPFPRPSYENKEKLFDVVLFADLIDVEGKKKTWETLFSEKAYCSLLKALQYAKKHPGLHPAIFCGKFVEEGISVNDMVFEIEEYLYAERLKNLIESIENIKIHLFGEHAGNNWLVRLKNRENVFLHAKLPFAEHFEVLKMTKVLIRDHPPFVDGGDDWAAAALAAGCKVFLPPNPFLKENFDDESFYNSFEELNEKIQRCLSRPMVVPIQQTPLDKSILSILTFMEKKK